MMTAKAPLSIHTSLRLGLVSFHDLLKGGLIKRGLTVLGGVGLLQTVYFITKKVIFRVAY